AEDVVPLGRRQFRSFALPARLGGEEGGGDTGADAATSANPAHGRIEEDTASRPALLRGVSAGQSSDVIAQVSPSIGKRWLGGQQAILDRGEEVVEGGGGI